MLRKLNVIVGFLCIYSANAEGVSWEKAEDGKVPVNAVEIPTRSGKPTYFCKALGTSSGDTTVGIIDLETNACEYAVDKKKVESSLVYQILTSDPETTEIDWKYARRKEIPSGAVKCGLDCYLGVSVYGDGLCLESFGRISPAHNTIYMTEDKEEVYTCPFYMFMITVPKTEGSTTQNRL